MSASVTAQPGGGIRLLLGAAAFVVVVAGMRAAVTIVVPFLLSLFIAVLCTPALAWMRRKGIPSLVSVILVIAAIALLTLSFGAILGTSIADFTFKLPQYQENLRSLTRSIETQLYSWGLDTSEGLLGQYVDPAAAMQLAATLLGQLGSLLKDAFLILITVLFLLAEATALPKKLTAITDTPARSLARIEQVMANVNRYMAIKTMVSVLTGSAVTIWLTILGVDFALLWGVLAFLLNYVPNLGSIIAAVPAVLLAMIQYGPGRGALAAVGFLVINLVMGVVLEPRFMGRGLDLSTLVVFLSLVFWGWVLGPIGMLLSVPLTMTARIVLESRPDTRWIAVLLSAGVAEATSEKAPPAHS